MPHIVSVDVAVSKVTDGMTVMIGGFIGCGTPHHLVDALALTDVKDLTVIANDGGRPDWGVGRLITARKVRTLVASHVGLNPDIAAQMNAGELEVQLVPQGSLVEKIRAGGAGLGGVLTPTGLGTLAAEGKQVVTIKGKDFLLEEPLRADVALISGYEIDTSGNIWYKGTTRNFNVVMATAAETVVAEADHIVQVGYLKPEDVVTPGVFVDYIVDGDKL